MGTLKRGVKYWINAGNETTPKELQQLQQNISPKLSVIDSQQTNQGRLHVFFPVILYHPKSYSLSPT
jgi:hypothetical protein